MCGICGIVDFAADAVEARTVVKMTRTLRHRGPDDCGTFINGPVGLGHTRLSIIDLSETGHQPMQSRDESVTLVYNGEVYNFQTLRVQLENEGAIFRGRSDTEVVLEAYLRWGVEAFRRFNGIFALAIWDARTQVLHCARDRFGVKPFYYRLRPSGIIFGSEIKAILAAERESRSINAGALHEYLHYGNALGANTLFEGIYKLLPGHYLSVTRSRCETRPYWQAEDVERVSASPGEAKAQLRELLEQAVRTQLVSDVPVGVFLSGGIDSSCITAFASKHYEGRLQTFSVGFDFDRGVNELPKARMVADYFHTEHHELHISGGDLCNVIESLVRCHDEPFADAANIPLFLLCQELRGAPKVILQGDGGDEIFAGYRRYNVLSAHRLWRSLAPLGLWATRHSLPGVDQHRLARFCRAVQDRDDGMRMALLLTEESQAEPPTRILAEEWREALALHDPFARYRMFNQRLAHLDPVQRMLYTDASILLPDTFLEKVDKSTMAHGIEVRVPLLDHPLTEYMMGLPANLKVRWGRKKWLLRQALRGIVPDAILDAPKTGFGVPYSYWLRKPLAGYLRSILLDPAVLAWKLFDENRLSRCIEEHVTRRRDHGFLLWKVLNLALWCQFYKIRMQPPG